MSYWVEPVSNDGCGMVSCETLFFLLDEILNDEICDQIKINVLRTGCHSKQHANQVITFCQNIPWKETSRKMTFGVVGIRLFWQF